MKYFIVILLSCVFLTSPLMAEGSDLSGRVGDRIKECEKWIPHIKDYIKIALLTYKEEDLEALPKEEQEVVIENTNYFFQSGRLVMTEEQKQIPEARACVYYAEGMMAMGKELRVKQAMLEAFSSIGSNE